MPDQNYFAFMTHTYSKIQIHFYEKPQVTEDMITRLKILHLIACITLAILNSKYLYPDLDW